jgi:hypothetical protein
MTDTHIASHARAGWEMDRKTFLRLAGMTGGAVAAGDALLGTPLSAAAVATTASAPDPGPILGGPRFPIGLFWPPPPLQTTLSRYQEIVDAGFTFSHSNDYLYADFQIQEYVLSIADQVGLQVLVDDPDIRWLMNWFTINDAGGDFTLTTQEATTVISGVLSRYQLKSTWSIQNGQLLINGGSGNGTIGLSATGDAWTDYSFGFDATPLQTGGGTAYAQAGWAFRAKDPSNAYVWLLSNQAYTSAKAPGYLAKALFVNGSPAWVRPVELPFAVVGGTSYAVATTVSGDTITTSINGTVVDTTTDSTYASGRVGFRMAGSESGRFDNVRVTGPSGTVLLSDDFSDGFAKWDRPATGHPSFAGLDVFDEPSDAKLATIGEAVTIVRSLNPDALPYLNLLPGFDGNTGYEKAAQIAKPLELSFDRYPILASGEDTGYFQNWEAVRAVSLAHDIPSWVYIQSVGYNGHAVPTYNDLLWQINVSLSYGCKGIQYFTYWTPDPARGEGFTKALLTTDGRRTPLYAAAKQINTQYLSRVGRQLLPLTSSSVSGANIASLPNGLPAFVPDDVVTGVSGGPAIIGRFTQSGETTQWVLVANFVRQSSTNVTVAIASSATSVQAYDPSTDSWIDRGHSVVLQLAPGAAQLLRVTP